MKQMKRVVSGIAAFLLALTLVVTVVNPTTVKADGYDTGIPEIQLVTAEIVNPNGNGEATTASSLKVSITAVDDVAMGRVNFNFDVKSEDGSRRKYVGGGWYYCDREDNPNWTVTPALEGHDAANEAHVYTCVVPLTDVDYKGILYLSSVWVEDKAGNTRHYDSSGTVLNVKMAGSQEIPESSSSSTSKNFTVQSVEALDANGNPYKSGSVISPGTVVTYKVTVGSDVPQSVQTMSLGICTDLPNTSSRKNIDITRAEDTNVFQGQFTFDEQMYPTAWYPYQADYWIRNETGTESAYASLYHIDTATLVLKFGNQVVYPTSSLSVNTLIYDFSAGSVHDVWETIASGLTVPKYTKLSDYVTIPTAPTLVEGVPSNWHVLRYQYNSETKESSYVDLGLASDYVIGRDSYNNVTLVALPDGYLPMSVKVPIFDGTTYQNKYVAEWVKATTRDEVIAYAKNKYLEEAKKVFSDADLVLNPNGHMMGLVDIVCDTDEVVVIPQARYVQEKEDDTWFKFIDFPAIKCTLSTLPSVADIKATFDKNVTLTGTPRELTFQGWGYQDDQEIQRYLDNIKIGGIYEYDFAYATYDKDVVVSTYWHENPESVDGWESWDFFDYFPKGMTNEQVEAELKIRTPGGYTNWEKDDFFEYMGARFFYFDTNGDKASNTITGTNGQEIKFEATEPKVESKQDAAGKTVVESTVAFDLGSTKTENGVTSLTTESVNKVVNLVKETLDTVKAATGEVATPKVKVSMANATVIPTDILEAAKGSNIDVEFVMTADDGSTYSWTINGSSITSTNLKNVNLKVNKNTTNVPATVIGTSAANGMPNIQINLADHGLFGFTAGLKYYVGKEYAGQYANLLYYTDGRLEIQNSCAVDADGYTVLTFTHASDYVIAMGKDLVAASKSPATGDQANVTLYLLLLMAGVLAIATSRRKVR